MIARLKGHLHPLSLDEVIIDVAGVGYHVHVPVGTAGRAPQDEDGRVTLLIHTAVREDAIQLFGFATEQEKAVYRELIGVSRIGPKLGLSVLSGLTVSEIVNAVRANEFQPFTDVNGVGKKTAQRLLLELQNRLDDLPASVDVEPHIELPDAEEKLMEDLRSALVNLEHKPAIVDDVVRQLRPVASDYDGLQALLRRGLQIIHSDGSRR